MLVYYFMINAYNQNPLITILSGGAPPMDQSFIDRVYEGFEYERSRTGPPEDFPDLPKTSPATCVSNRVCQQ